MTVKEIIILGLKNRPGELSRIISHLYESDVRVSAFWVGTEKKNDTLRFIAGDPEVAMTILTGLGFTAKIVEVIAARLPDHPGGLNAILKLLQSANINILYIYPFLETPRPALILEVDKTEEAVTVLKNNWIHLYDQRV